MMTDIEIAQSATPRHILEIAKEAGVDEKARGATLSPQRLANLADVLLDHGAIKL